MHQHTSGGQSIPAKRRIIRSTTLIALFAALIAAGTFIAIPLPLNPVPLVLQNLFALLAGLILGPLRGGAAVALYLIAGALGAPIFAGGAGGFVHFFAPSGGYLFGYLLAAMCAGLIAGTPKPGVKTPLWRMILGTALGLLVVYVPGLIWLKRAAQCTWIEAAALGFLPFLLGDGIKGVIAVLLSPRMRRLVADQGD